MTAVQAIDCATQLSAGQAQSLKAAGVKTVIRYLVDPDGASGWKALTVKEVRAISSAGLEIVSVYETDPLRTKYFTKGKGVSDAKSAMACAKAVGQPHASTIYFAVDYDVPTVDLSVIKAYFAEIKATLKDYKVGVYGSYSVLEALQGQVTHYWQTYAWSSDKLSSLANLYQYQNGQTLAGVSVDYDRVISDCGSWVLGKVSKPTASKPAPKPATYSTHVVKKGEVLSVIGANLGVDWHEIATLNGIKSPYTIYPEQKLKIPAGAKATSQAKYHMVVSGDTAWDIAQANHTTVAQLQKLNPSIKDMDKIFPGQKMKVK